MTTPDEKIPTVGMLIVAKHKPESFKTILEVTQKEPHGPALKVLFLRVSDNKKILTVWYPNPETFWTYYEEK